MINYQLLRFILHNPMYPRQSRVGKTKRSQERGDSCKRTERNTNELQCHQKELGDLEEQRTPRKKKQEHTEQCSEGRKEREEND